MTGRKAKNIEVPPRITQIFSLFYFMRLWRVGDVSDFSKFVQMILYFNYPASLLAGAFTNANETQQIFMIVASIITVVLTVRLYYILWKKDEILGFVHTFGSHSIQDNDQYNRVTNRISTLMKSILLLELMTSFCIVGLAVTSLPIFTTEKKLPLNVYIPLDWKHNDFIYWTAYVLLVYDFVLTLVCILQNVIVSYLMMSCAIQYETLGIELRNVGYISEGKRSNEEQFYVKLLDMIRRHQELQK